MGQSAQPHARLVVPLGTPAEARRWPRYRWTQASCARPGRSSTSMPSRRRATAPCRPPWTARCWQPPSLTSRLAAPIGPCSLGRCASSALSPSRRASSWEGRRWRSSAPRPAEPCPWRTESRLAVSIRHFGARRSQACTKRRKLPRQRRRHRRRPLGQRPNGRRAGGWGREIPVALGRMSGGGRGKAGWRGKGRKAATG